MDPKRVAKIRTEIVEASADRATVKIWGKTHTFFADFICEESRTEKGEYDITLQYSGTRLDPDEFAAAHSAATAAITEAQEKVA